MLRSDRTIHRPIKMAAPKTTLNCFNVISPDKEATQDIYSII